MINISLILIIAGILVCIAGSNFFSSSEMSYSSASKVRMEHEAEEGSRKAAAALWIMEHFDRALATILIGNNLVNIAASSLVSVLVLIISGSDRYTWIGTAGVTILVIIFGETIPKIIAKKKPNTLALAYAHVIRALMIILFPVIWIIVKLAALISMPFKSAEPDDQDEVQEEAMDELQAIIETAEDEGVLKENESELLQAAIDFSEKSASEEMTSRVDMDAINVDDPIDEIMALIQETPFSRLPVYEDSIDNIIGVLHVNHLLKSISDLPGVKPEDIDIRSLMMPACFVYKTMKLPEVLKLMRKAKQHLAIVTDEYGGTLGCITMEDVLEEIVGDIWDESDEPEEEVVERKSDEFEVDGDMSTRDFIELTGLDEHGIDEDEFESETVGGWIIETLGHYPDVGEEFDFKDLHIRVLSKDDRRVERIYIKKKSDIT